MAVFLYQSTPRIDLSVCQSAQNVNWNLAMDRCDFKIFTGVDTKVEFAVRNLDRKPIVLEGQRLRAIVADRYSETVLGQVYLTPLNVNKGLYELKLSKQLTANWPIVALNYSVVVESLDGTETLLFVDQYQEARGFCQVVPSILYPIRDDSFENDYNFPAMPANLVNTFRVRLDVDQSNDELLNGVFKMQIRTDRSPNSQLIADLTQQNGGVNLVYENQQPFLDLRFGPLNQVIADAVLYYEIVLLNNNQSTILLQGSMPFEAGVLDAGGTSV